MTEAPGMPTAARLKVGLGARSYDIVIGRALTAGLGAAVAPLLTRPRIVVVTDSEVAARHLDGVTQALSAHGLSVDSIVLEPGEGSKSFASLERLIDRLLELNVERDDVLMALGGGVVGDVTGFAAAILKRGCRYVQIPTTLLAQVDSAVGGKTGVNVARGKNLVGAFHQPALVVADIDLLATLPERQLRAGLAEVVKYGLIDDADFFAWMEKNGADAAAGGASALIYAVHRSCAAKARIVGEDEREAGRRALLNFGHTFGHALEAACGYSDALLHGEAVAVGMTLAFEYSAAQRLCPAADALRVKACLAALGLPTSLGDIPRLTASADELLETMANDKKVVKGRLRLVLARAIGRAEIVEIDDTGELRAFLQSKLDERPPATQIPPQ